MKTHKLLKKLGSFLSASQKEQRAETRKIREVLKKLKEKEKDLNEKLGSVTDPDDRVDIEAKLEVVRAQRLKGVERVRELRGGRSASA